MWNWPPLRALDAHGRGKSIVLILRRGAVRLALATVLLFLAACSSTTFVYNRMDFLVPWYVNDYTDLNGEQEDYLDDLLAPFLAWHRSQELPRYIELIAQIEASLDAPASAASVEEIASQLEQAWLRLEGESLDWLLDLGTQLDDVQVEAFLNELWQQQREFEEKYLERSEQEFYADSAENMADTAEDFFGRLSKDQSTIIKTGTAKLQRSDAAWLREREAWLNKLGVILKRQPGWQQQLRAAVAARPETVSAEYRQAYEHNAQVLYATLAALLNSRNVKQDRHLRSELAELRIDLEALVAQGRRSHQDG